jgi:tetratricopeptide (TPR) repeat protein
MVDQQRNYQRIIKPSSAGQSQILAPAGNIGSVRHSVQNIETLIVIDGIRHMREAVPNPQFQRFPSSNTSQQDQAEAYYDQEGRKAYEAKEWGQAITLLKQALEGKDHALDDDDQTATTRKLYAQALHMAGKHRLATAQFQSTVLWAEKKLGPGHIETLKRRMSWGYALQASSLSVSAREQFRLAYEGFESAVNSTDRTNIINSLHCRYQFGILASEHEAYDRQWPYWLEAEQSLLRAMQGFTQHLPAGKEAFEAQIGYATALLRMCREEEALGQFESMLKIARRKGLPKGDDNVQKIKSAIEECNFWLHQPAALRLGNRLPLARERAEKQRRDKDLREWSLNWSKR